MKHQTIIAIRAILFFTVLTGIVYPLLITGVAQLAFKNKANGSIVYQNGKPIGSTLIGQSFASEKYFWPRPSAVDYNSTLSGVSNLGPTSAKLRHQVEERRQNFIQQNKLPRGTVVPAEMVTSSGSGLDPHISPQAAMLQLNRVAKARGFSSQQQQKVTEIIRLLSSREGQLSLGDARINVFELNLMINQLQ
jgi:potassium-transporting ATPase KdpC subunit